MQQCDLIANLCQMSDMGMMASEEYEEQSEVARLVKSALANHLSYTETNVQV